ncbi:MAG TPA: hypothetical protein VHR47_05645 [Bacillota bacterium]|nr:hypothetical protein [Bacillota bacterium]
MDTTDAITVIKEAYMRLGPLTPLKDNCGRLCAEACCQEQEEITGMYLFPGEEELLSTKSFNLIPTTITLKSGKKITLAVCNGHCSRAERPLACRIFPLTPYITPDGRVTTVVDPRAMPICPLTRPSGIKQIQPRFIRAVEDLAQLLGRHLEIRDFLETVSRVIDEAVQL